MGKTLFDEVKLEETPASSFALSLLKKSTW